MSAVGNELKMLLYLKCRKKMTISELAERLEVGNRQIERYKEDLEDVGINIKTVKGKYGGYELEDKEYLSSLSVSKNEIQALTEAESQLVNCNFANIEDFRILVMKIMSVNDKKYEIHDYFIKNKGINNEFEDEKKMWININAAIVSLRKINIEYHSLKNEIKTRIIRPYAIFQYENSLYVAGFCELRNDIRYFKLSRINKCETLETKFTKDKNFNLKEYLKESFGIYNGEKINVKIKVKYPMSQIIKEKIWINNQKITENPKDNSIILEGVTSDTVEVKSWILSMGSSVEIIEPEKLKNELIDELKKMIKIYKNI